MTTSLDAADPHRNATVRASAGTGKTWLLVTRIVRLLLAGTRPEGIVAVTFTRKAAAEMQTRLAERLQTFLEADDRELDAALAVIGVAPDAGTRTTARRLYETLLFSEHPLRATTFHAFCQELLQRFPLEADVPPGFELLEAAGGLEQDAVDALFADATAAPDGAVAGALETLFDAGSGIPNTDRALRQFLAHRSDWWAYTADTSDPVDHAAGRLAGLLAIEPDTAPADGFLEAPARHAHLREFADLLGRHPTKTNLEHQAGITMALDPASPLDARLAAARSAFFTATGSRRSRTPSKAMEGKLGAAGQARFLELHDRLCDDLEALQDRQARHGTWRLSTAWYRAGHALVEHYQRLKREQRLLDFTDLEWRAYRLLHHSDNAHWVQYKLDARVDHLLVDEFQDTNPTQWRLLLPLLEELAAGDAGRARSVFLVGDAKQSIYRFRRADARLLGTAARWLAAGLGAADHTLDASRRSAPAVIDAVNRTFAHPPLTDALPDFQPHGTHLDGLWGRVELLPLAQAEAAPIDADTAALRHPLRVPRLLAEDLRHYREGQAIAAHIRNLVDSGTLVGDAEHARPMTYGDVMFLLRSRTHAHHYERALRDAGIPYLGAGRGTLLESLEVRDLEALLNTLITPFDDLALAQVLRSPVFAADDADLMTLAAHGGGPWMERLDATAAAADSPLGRARRLLARWRGLAGQIPVHDLLDRIYHEGDVPARYLAAFPAPLRPRVRANLTRFIDLALAVDGGRYPSLPHFLDRLRDLRVQVQDAPDEAPPEGDADDRVRMLTIHGAKGLEAPVVFLADAGGHRPPARAFEALLDWPAEDDRPRYFLLTGRRAELDSVSRALLDEQLQAERREDANLLYVALTRARQLLFVSGCAGGADDGWYGLVRDALRDPDSAADTVPVPLESGAPPSRAAVAAPAPPTPPAVDPRLAAPLVIRARDREIAPSRHDHREGPGSGDPDARDRGIVIHRALDLLGDAPPDRWPALAQRLARELQRPADDPELHTWWQEAVATVRAPAFADLFDPGRYRHAYREVPIQYHRGDALVHGVIDRLVVADDGLRLVDYKTHAHATPDTLPALASGYREQMHLYADGVARLWPGRPLRAWLLFTACRLRLEITLDGNP